MSIDKPAIINWALTEIGAGAIFSSEDDSDLSLQIENVWQRTIDECFSLEQWHWARQTRKLSRVTPAVETGYAYAYGLPENKIGGALAYYAEISPCRRICHDFQVNGGQVYCNETQLYWRGIVEIAVDDWDVAFRSAFTLALSARLAVPVFQDKALAEKLDEQAFGTPSEKRRGGQFGLLIAQNKAQEPMDTDLYKSDPLSDARYASDPYTSWAGRYA